MAFALRVIGAATPTDAAFLVPESGRYFRQFDVGACHGEEATFPTTARLSEAATFPDVMEALEFWRTQSRERPMRDDGLPNRPLTAFTVELVTV